MHPVYLTYPVIIMTISAMASTILLLGRPYNIHKLLPDGADTKYLYIAGVAFYPLLMTVFTISVLDAPDPNQYGWTAYLDYSWSGIIGIPLQAAATVVLAAAICNKHLMLAGRCMLYNISTLIIICLWHIVSFAYLRPKGDDIIYPYSVIACISIVNYVLLIMHIVLYGDYKEKCRVFMLCMLTIIICTVLAKVYISTLFKDEMTIYNPYEVIWNTISRTMDPID
jgi:hypothetical protein